MYPIELVLSWYGQMLTEWRQFAAWKNISPQEFQDSGSQDRNAVVRPAQPERAVKEFVSPGMLRNIEAGVPRSGMSVRLSPYTLQQEHVITNKNWAGALGGSSSPILG
jgi:hypothetical protein